MNRSRRRARRTARRTVLLAVLVAALGLVALVLGVLRQVVWVPETAVTSHVSLGASGGLVVVPQNVVELRGVPTAFDVRGPGRITVALGRTQDVTAWTGETRHTTLTGLSSQSAFAVARSGAQPAGEADPTGSDLWLAERSATGTVRLDWAELTRSARGVSQPLSLLVSGHGTGVTSLGLTWRVPVSSSWGSWAIGLGAVAFTAGIVLLLVIRRNREIAAETRARRRTPAAGAPGPARARSDGAPATARDEAPGPEPDERDEPGKDEQGTPGRGHDEDRHDPGRGSGGGSGGPGGSGDGGRPAPTRRGRHGSGAAPDTAPIQLSPAGRRPGRHSSRHRAERRALVRRAAAVLAACAIAVPATACGGQQPLPRPSAVASSVAPAAAATVSETQARTILGRVDRSVAEADRTGQADGLAARVDGPALDVRRANLTIRAAMKDYPAAQTLDSARVLRWITTTQVTWPREVAAVVQVPGQNVPGLIVLRQQDPRAPYKLWAQLRLLPNVSVPATADPRAGTTQLGPGAELGVTPQDTVARYADVLTHGDASSWRAGFSSDAFLTDQLDYQNRQRSASPEAQFAFSHQPVPDALASFATADGGGIVVASLHNVNTVTPAHPGGSITASGATGALLGPESSAQGIESTYGETIAFVVPPRGSKGQTKVIGADLALLSARRL